MKKFNNGNPIKKELSDRIEQYFEYYWSKNLTVAFGEEDENIWMQMPAQLNQQILQMFLFTDFFKIFHSFFKVPDLRATLKHCYIQRDNIEFQEFMVRMMKDLEPILEPANQIIFYELEEIMSIKFYTKGVFFIGYELNNEQFFPIGFNNSLPQTF